VIIFDKKEGGGFSYWILNLNKISDLFASSPSSRAATLQ
jgi:hypothetical protein